MPIRVALACVAIVCLSAMHANKNVRRSVLPVADSMPVTQCSVKRVAENQSNVAVDVSKMRVVEGEFLPVNSPFSTVSAPVAQPVVDVYAAPVNQTFGSLASNYPQYAPPVYLNSQAQVVRPYVANRQSHPAMQVQNYNLFQYRRMMINHPTVNPQELQGSWRGVNKGLATVAIDEQFIKHFQAVNGQVYGDNISVHQVPLNQVGRNGWQPKFDSSTGALTRQGKFKVTQARGIGAFRHGLVLSYRDGGNSRRDPARLIEDRLVKLDDNHMLGRAAVKFGPLRIPMAYFVLERVQ